MSGKKWLKRAALLLAGAWLPITVTCNPSAWDGVVRITGDRCCDGGYVHGWCDDDCDEWGFNGWWDGFDFDFEYDD